MIIQPTFHTAQHEQNESLRILLKTYLSTLAKSLCRHPATLSMNDSAAEVFEGNETQYAQVLSTMHMLYGLSRDYKEERVFEAFPTLGDAYEYIAFQLMIKDGYIDVETT